MSVPEWNFELTEPARNDLQDILAYTLDTWGEAQLAEYRSKINDAFGLIRDNPQLGRTRHGRLVYSVGRHRIFYRCQGATIYILRILHDRMDARRHLAGT